MALLPEAFAVGATPTLSVARLPSTRGWAKREVLERGRGVSSALAASAAVLVSGAVANRRMADTRACAVRAGRSRRSGRGAAQGKDGAKGSQAPKSPYEEQDPMELMKQLLGGDFSTPPGW
eukprot:s186_g19.t1